MFAGAGADAAGDVQTLLFAGIEPNEDLSIFQVQVEILVIERKLLKYVDIIFAAFQNQLLSLSSQQFTGLVIRQMGKFAS